MPVHGVTFVRDDDLAGEQWVFIRLPRGGAHVFICESAVTPETLEKVWAAYRKSIDIPAQRRPSDADAMPRSAASG